MATESDLDYFCFIYSIVLFSFTLAAELFVFIKVKMRLDLSMIFIALAYLLSFGLRAFIDGKLNSLSACASLLIQGIMFYFVFEMMRLKDKLSSESQ